ncbi:PREDICTED: protein FAM195A, partial [Myotis brandtii]|uniref:protein FAM195A n=1 Tax=Myotis brandtii TaxID=109478 RepID=UPI0003BBDADC
PGWVGWGWARRAGHPHDGPRGTREESRRAPSPGPRLVFNRVNGRRPPTTSPSTGATQETYTLAHEENVRFVSEAWQQVEQQLGGGPAGESSPRPVQYVERTPNPRLQNFVPIDLDEWWAQQFLARITNCS